MPTGDPDPMPEKGGQVGRVGLTRVEVRYLNPCSPGRLRLVERVNVASPRRRPAQHVNRRARPLEERATLDAADYRPTVGPVYWYGIS